MSDSKLVRGFQARLLELPEGLLVAALYAAACWASRQVSLDQFFLPAGIRIAALLLCRRAIWPYLLLGECAYFAYLRLPLIDKYGLEWVIVSSAYQFPVVALVVLLHSRSISKGTDTWLLTVAAFAAVLIGLGTLLIAHALRPIPPSGGFAAIAFRNTLGDYIAILTVAPLALLWIKRRDVDWSSLFTSRSSCAGLSIVVCGVVSILIPHDLPAVKATVQLLMAVPVIVLTCLQGWWGGCRWSAVDEHLHSCRHPCNRASRVIRPRLVQGAATYGCVWNRAPGGRLKNYAPLSPVYVSSQSPKAGYLKCKGVPHRW